jgi:hypothetical protein
MKDEALKLALEALESCDQVYGSEGSYQYFSQAKVDKAITAIKQALAAPVQEPVAWGKPTDEMVQAATDEYDEWAVDNKGTTECIRAMLVKALKATTPAAQRQLVGLTDYEIGVCSTEAAMNRSEMVGGAVTFARAIEAKLKEKNT